MYGIRGEVYIFIGQHAMTTKDGAQSETVQENTVDVLLKDCSLWCWLAKPYYVGDVCTLVSHCSVMCNNGYIKAVLHCAIAWFREERDFWTPDIEPLQHGVDLIWTVRKMQPHNDTYRTFHRKLRIRASTTETLAETDCMHAGESEATARAFLLTCLEPSTTERRPALT